MLPLIRNDVALLFPVLFLALSGCQGATPNAAPATPPEAAPPAATPPAATPPAATAAAPTTSSAAPGPVSPPPPPGASARPPAPPEDFPDDAGGPCEYAELPGTCTISADKTFSFTGTIDGKTVTLNRNTLDPVGQRPKVGTPVACTIKFMKAGTCTPCRFSIGSIGGTCGEAAQDVFRARLRR